MESKGAPSFYFTHSRFLFFAVPFCLGIGAAVKSGFAFSALLLLPPLLFALCAAFLLRRKKEACLRLFLIFCGLLLALVAVFPAECRIKALAGKEVEIKGVVSAEKENGVELRLLNGGFEKVFFETENAPLPLGTVLNGTARFSRAKDEEQTENSVFLTGKWKGVPIQSGSDPLFSALGGIRRFFSHRLDKLDHAGFFRAVLLGDRSGLTETELAAFSDAGISHLLALSGLHLSILFGFCDFFLSLFLHGRARNVFSLVLIAVFCAVTGFIPSAVRAGLMLTSRKLGALFGRRSDPLLSLGFAAVLILLFSPGALFSPSFQFSFAAVLGILCLAAPLMERFSDLLGNIGHSLPFFLQKAVLSVLSIFCLSGAVFTASFPLGMINLGGGQPLAPLLNLLFIPAFTPVLFCGFLTAVLFLPAPLYSLLCRITDSAGSLFLRAAEKTGAVFSASVLPEAIAIPAALCSAGMLLYCLRKNKEASFLPLWFTEAAFLLISSCFCK